MRKQDGRNLLYSIITHRSLSWLFQISSPSKPQNLPTLRRKTIPLFFNYNDVYKKFLDQQEHHAFHRNFSLQKRSSIGSINYVEGQRRRIKNQATSTEKLLRRRYTDTGSGAKEKQRTSGGKGVGKSGESKSTGEQSTIKLT